MKGFGFPQRSEITHGNQLVFDRLTAILGTVPNLYAGFAWSENALTTYLALEGSKSSLSARQREAIQLIVSQINDCDYGITAHSEIARMNGFTPEEIEEIRRGSAGFDKKLDCMVRLTRNIMNNRDACEDAALGAFYQAGLTKENLVDLVLVIGYTVIANYLQALIRVPIDFPLTEDWENPLRHREG